MTFRLSGKPLRLSDEGRIKKAVGEGRKIPFLIVFDPREKDSLPYVGSVSRFLALVGLPLRELTIEDQTDYMKALDAVKANDAAVILARPLKPEWEEGILKGLSSRNDPDMQTAFNKSLLYSGNIDCLPATAKAVLRLLSFYGIQVTGKKALVIGRSLTVGLPIARGLLDLNALVEIAHSKVPLPALRREAKEADILVLASGKVGLVDRDSLNSNQVIVDVGYHASTHSGDLGFVPLEGEVQAYTPVPGGLGPLTVSTLVLNAYGLWGQSI